MSAVMEIGRRAHQDFLKGCHRIVVDALRPLYLDASDQQGRCPVSGFEAFVALATGHADRGRALRAWFSTSLPAFGEAEPIFPDVEEIFSSASISDDRCSQDAASMHVMRCMLASPHVLITLRTERPYDQGQGAVDGVHVHIVIADDREVIRQAAAHSIGSIESDEKRVAAAAMLLKYYGLSSADQLSEAVKQAARLLSSDDILEHPRDLGRFTP
jgi:hypothetical protein